MAGEVALRTGDGTSWEGGRERKERKRYVEVAKKAKEEGKKREGVVWKGRV
jgi:hypothetical protein